jgi:putative ABC transport system permease protein
MYKSYFKISLRHLIKNKTFTFINLFGLTLGFLSFMLLGLYIQDELSFDLFHKDTANMYRVLQHEKQEDGTVRHAAEIAGLIGKESSSAFPEIQAYCRITAFGRVTLGNDPANRNYHRVMTADVNFFSFFDFPLVEGAKERVLRNPDEIVLNETLAKRYFGTESPIGKRIWSSMTRESDGSLVEFTVVGVMKDFPKNSHLQLEALFSDASWPGIFDEGYNEFVTTDWTSNEYVTYVKLKPTVDVGSLSTKVNALVKSHYPVDTPFRSEFSFQLYNKIHLYSENILGNGITNNDSGIKPYYLYMFGVVGFLLVLIACLNYMNLATAAAFKRTREIGMRKSLGAPRGQLLAQFVIDSFLIASLSFSLSIGLLNLLFPSFRAFTQKELLFESLPLAWYSMIAGAVTLTAILSAIYPAMISLKTSTVSALKGEINVANQRFNFRKLMLAAQFTISIGMITSTLIIYNQLKFMREKDLGMDVESLLVIDINSGNLRRNFETVKAEFAKPAEVMNIATSTRVPGEWKSFPIATVNAEGDSRKNEMIYVGIDNDFLQTYNIQLTEGRNFNPGVSDSLKVILTESGAKQLGLTNPIGQIIEIPKYRMDANVEQLERILRVEIIGVANDFHFESLKKNLMPVIFAAPNTAIQRIDYYTLKIKTTNWDETVTKLKEINQKIDPNNPLEYTFLDNRFKEFYQADAKRGQVFLTFSIIIVLITCMGLFALVSYSVESRTKEIGVRKVLGASVNSIVGLVSKEFLVLVLAAGAIGLPVSWYLMNSWLQEFAYHIPLGVEIFVLAILISLLIAFATIAIRAINAAQANPVKSLRSE